MNAIRYLFSDKIDTCIFKFFTAVPKEGRMAYLV